MLGPVAELRLARLPLLEPRGQIAAGFFDVAALVEPAEFGEALAVGLAGEVVDGVSQEMDVAALPHGFWQDLADGLAQPFVVVADGELYTPKAASLQADQEVLPRGRALAAGQADSKDATATFLIDADRDLDGTLPDDSALPNALVAGIQQDVGVVLLQRPFRELLEPWAAEVANLPLRLRSLRQRRARGAGYR